jgi:phosphoenolpyruvate carboxykinase (ATP)
VNTGWSGGAYGTGKRMKLSYTRAIVDAIHSGALRDVRTKNDPVFGLAIPESCPGVPDEILFPRNTWDDKAAYDATCRKLAKLFADNFQHYEEVAGKDVSEAGPRLQAA